MDISGDILNFAPENYGMSFLPGDTIEARLRLCDKPDLCFANCAEYAWHFCLVPPFECDRRPNPFTPNGDGTNDFVQFAFSRMGYEAGTIYVYDLHGVEIWRTSIPIGGESKQNACWSGRDSNNNPLRQGLYIYLIESGGEIVCEGTVTIAR